MMKTAIKEWAGVITALGTGQQTVLVRKYEPPVKTFLLYPTFNYCNSSATFPDEFNQKIQEKYRKAALEAGLTTKKKAQESCLVDLAYMAEVENCVGISNLKAWKELCPFYIWTSHHVQEYAAKAKGETCFVWIIRVSKLTPPLEIGRFNQGGPPHIYHHHEEFALPKTEPVLNDKSFLEQQKQILEVCEKFGASISTLK